jgi:hypothetical protein
VTPGGERLIGAPGQRPADVPRDTPGRERTVRERGTYAGAGDDPTLASHLSSLFLLLSVPAFVALAYLGHGWGYYGVGGVVPAFGGLLVGSLVLAFAAMHVLSEGR